MAIRNSGWKAVAIGPNTVANYPAALSLNNLVVDAPADSFNQLLLNWAGLSVPLSVRSTLTIGRYGSLASHHSALSVATAYIEGTAAFSDYATEDFGQLWLRSGATLSLTNGTMTCSNLTFYSATLTQTGGTNIVQNIKLPVVTDPYAAQVYGSYLLESGTLLSQQLALGFAVGPFGSGDGNGLLWQTGGVHTNSSMNLEAWYHPGGSTLAGAYVLDAGLLASGAVTNNGGYFNQNGGTSIIRELTVSGGSSVQINGGELITSNTIDRVDTYVGGRFVQTNGTHSVQGSLLVQGRQSPGSPPEYDLFGGRLTAANIVLSSSTLRVSSHGIISNTGVLLLSGGTLRASDPFEVQHPGQLQCSGGHLAMHEGCFPAAVPTVFRFADSRALPWTGTLQIHNYGSNPGDQIFISTNAQGLTTAQLDLVQFVGCYDELTPAALLPTGELVPVSGTNAWTKPGSGDWEEAYWSLGRLPGMDQGLVSVSNSGWKAVSIGANTTANFPASLSMYNLVIDAPASSFNQLLLNWAGLSVPLDIHWNLTIGTNGSLASHASALRASNADIYGALSLADNSHASLNQIRLRPAGTLTLADGFLTCSNLNFDGGTLSQIGGTNIAENITLPVYDYLDYYYGLSPPSFYNLDGGALLSSNVLLDSTRDEYGATVAGTFVQTGGFHTNTVLTLYNRSSADAKGRYILNGGVLVSALIDDHAGSFAQHGGTNIVGELVDKGDFTLDGGLLISSNVSIGFSILVQTGGTHIVTSNLLIGFGYDYQGGRSKYDLSGGKLVTSNIDLFTGTLALSSQGMVSNAGTLTFSSYFPGAIRADNLTQPQYLGALQLPYGGTVDLHSEAAQPVQSARKAPVGSPTILRFRDSHTLAWSGQLQITNWGLNSGDRIFFGTNSQALTQTQLGQIQFTTSDTNLAAMLLASGELVPVTPVPLVATKIGNALVLSWSGTGYELVTATNVTGPYFPVPAATSPFTNTFVDSKRFFRIGLPSQ